VDATRIIQYKGIKLFTGGSPYLVGWYGGNEGPRSEKWFIILKFIQ
jgi:hypothetical protein